MSVGQSRDSGRRAISIVVALVVVPILIAGAVWFGLQYYQPEQPVERQVEPAGGATNADPRTARPDHRKVAGDLGPNDATAGFGPVRLSARMVSLVHGFWLPPWPRFPAYHAVRLDQGRGRLRSRPVRPPIGSGVGRGADPQLPACRRYPGGDVRRKSLP